MLLTETLNNQSLEIKSKEYDVQPLCMANSDKYVAIATNIGIYVYKYGEEILLDFLDMEYCSYLHIYEDKLLIFKDSSYIKKYCIKTKKIQNIIANQDIIKVQGFKDDFYYLDKEGSLYKNDRGKLQLFTKLFDFFLSPLTGSYVIVNPCGIYWRGLTISGSLVGDDAIYTDGEVVFIVRENVITNLETNTNYCLSDSERIIGIVEGELYIRSTDSDSVTILTKYLEDKDPGYIGENISNCLSSRYTYVSKDGKVYLGDYISTELEHKKIIYHNRDIVCFEHALEKEIIIYATKDIKLFALDYANKSEKTQITNKSPQNKKYNRIIVSTDKQEFTCFSGTNSVSKFNNRFVLTSEYTLDNGETTDNYYYLKRNNTLIKDKVTIESKGKYTLGDSFLYEPGDSISGLECPDDYVYTHFDLKSNRLVLSDDRGVVHFYTINREKNIVKKLDKGLYFSKDVSNISLSPCGDIAAISCYSKFYLYDGETIKTIETNNVIEDLRYSMYNGVIFYLLTNGELNSFNPISKETINLANNVTCFNLL